MSYRLTVEFWGGDAQRPEPFTWDGGDHPTRAAAEFEAGRLKAASEAGQLASKPPYLSRPGGEPPVAFLAYQVEELPC